VDKPEWEEFALSLFKEGLSVPEAMERISRQYGTRPLPSALLAVWGKHEADISAELESLSESIRKTVTPEFIIFRMLSLLERLIPDNEKFSKYNLNSAVSVLSQLIRVWAEMKEEERKSANFEGRVRDEVERRLSEMQGRMEEVVRAQELGLLRRIDI